MTDISSNNSSPEPRDILRTGQQTRPRQLKPNDFEFELGLWKKRAIQASLGKAADLEEEAGSAGGGAVGAVAAIQKRIAFGKALGTAFRDGRVCQAGRRGGAVVPESVIPCAPVEAALPPGLRSWRKARATRRPWSRRYRRENRQWRRSYRLVEFLEREKNIPVWQRPGFASNGAARGC